SPEQADLFPFQRLIEFGLPATSAGVLQKWLIGVGPGRVLNAMLSGARVLFHLEVFFLDSHQLAPLMLIKAFFSDRCILGQNDRLFIRAQIRIPQPLLAADFNRLESLDE